MPQFPIESLRGVSIRHLSDNDIDPEKMEESHSKAKSEYYRLEQLSETRKLTREESDEKNRAYTEMATYQNLYSSTFNRELNH